MREIPSAGETLLSGRLIHFAVRVSRRSRHPSLRSSVDGLEVVLPVGAETDAAQRLLRRHATWVLKQAGRIERFLHRRGPGLSPHEMLWRGEPVSVVAALKPGAAPVAERERGRILVPRTDGTEALRTWAANEVRRQLNQQLAHRSAQMKLPFRTWSLRDQRTRWGSCSHRTRSLSFNVRLGMAPPAVLDYLVIHELAHLQEANHSQRFWRLVAQHCPGHGSHRAFLRDRGSLLRWPTPIAAPAEAPVQLDLFATGAATAL